MPMLCMLVMTTGGIGMLQKSNETLAASCGRNRKRALENMESSYGKGNQLQDLGVKKYTLETTQATKQSILHTYSVQSRLSCLGLT